MRQSGILMHITSLPGPEGCGTLGPEAYAFADALKRSGVSLWQVLPCGPTGYGESPYQSSSVFAGNFLLVSVRKLAEDGLLKLTPEDVYRDENPEKADFDRVRAWKSALLRRAYRQSAGSLRAEIARFADEHPWARDYALFAALHERFGGVQWTKWPDRDLRMRKKEALRRAAVAEAGEIDFHLFVQYLFFSQWDEWKAYCHSLGIRLFGDMPIYVAEDSADTWTRPDVFQLDRDRVPRRVSGVPPDYFSEDGQLWGNPLYRWNRLRFLRRYDWWIDRMRGMQRMYDVIRIDHFIGFAHYWSVPYGAPNARGGKWVTGPGRSLFARLNRALPGLSIVAEDLGEVNDQVRRLIDYTGYPGMRVLCYGFGGGADNPHHPANHVQNAVLYTGTHDNDTLRGYLTGAGEQELKSAREALGFTSVEDGIDAFVTACFRSPCDTCVIPMQDLLGLGTEARMNLPGTVGGNWLWRMKEGAFTGDIQRRVLELNQRYGRMNPQ